jgi:hypothetical protein
MAVAATLPAAPLLLMGAIGELSTFDISSAKILPVTSAKPPAGKATTISMGREGYFSCDQDSVDESAINKTSIVKFRLFNCLIFVPPFRIKSRRSLWEA